MYNNEETLKKSGNFYILGDWTDGRVINFTIFGSDRSSRSHNLRSFRPIQVFLELSIFIILAQIF